MPLVTLYSNADPAPETVAGLLQEATTITAQELEKPESIVMARARLGEPMAMAGTTAPTFLVEVEGLGASDSATQGLTDAFCELGQRVLGVDPTRTFVKLHDVPRGRWGSNHKVF
ncbi:MAG: phenylpyruvate tautomerase MIF-related protein [Verrucomicrobiales bacterium]|jgi:phenylpyruvate tautomerase PptA (4-oxalocrotonate tautomerase family)|nr:phenylpyruvate tautomerase MIF-related protein [Verrucomicrobiales bacterium]